MSDRFALTESKGFTVEDRWQRVIAAVSDRETYVGMLQDRFADNPDHPVFRVIEYKPKEEVARR